MKLKKIMLTLTLLGSFALMSACGNNGQTTTSSTKAKTTESSEVDLNSLELPQLEEGVKSDEALVEMKTTEGSIKMKLFPEQAPKAVENFLTHAKEGYYDGTTFHRVMEDFMIQGGDPKGDGTGGESIWGEGFETEPSKQLYNIRGAVSMARSTDPKSNGSQFFIVQNTQDMSDGLAIQYYPEKIIEAYKKGGYPSLDGEYTVFGQVVEGMDVVDKIAKSEVKASQGGEKSTPVNPTKIESIEILQEPK